MTPKQKKLGKAKTNLKSVGIILLILALAVHLYLVFHYDFTQDDAYITFRYAVNYLNGYGLVYNIGERVEGYTNFLWTIFIILGGRAGIDFVLFSKILGVLFGLGTIIMLYFLAVEVFDRISRSEKSLLAGLCCLLLGSIYSFAYWTVAGLETAAFSFMVLASIFFYLRRSLLVVPSLVLSLLFRPEGGLVFLFLFIYEIIRHRSLTRYAMIAGILFVVYLLPFVFFKLFYYKSLLPNPFYAKTSFNLQQVVNGLEYTGQYFWHYLGAGLFVVPAFVTIRRASAGQRLCVMFFLIYTIYIILIGGDVLKVHRFFVPLFGIFILTAIYGLYKLMKNRLLLIAGVFALLVWELTIPYHHAAVFHGRELDLAHKMDRLMNNLLMADNSDFSLAVSTIGLVGYRLMGHTVIDLLGLTDSTISRHPEPPIEGMETTWRESHFNSRYVLSRQPDYILFSTGHKPSAPAERALFLYSSFLNNYKTVGFYFHGGLNDVYKRYFPIQGDIQRDVDVRFVQHFNQGINLQLDQKNYRASLATFDSAQKYSAPVNYPYIGFYKAIAFNKIGRMQESYEAIRRVIEIDTLIYEAYLNLCRIEHQLNNHNAALYYYGKTLELAPWHKSMLDSLLDLGKK
jgi:arabinofuranosyltransferase